MAIAIDSATIANVSPAMTSAFAVPLAQDHDEFGEAALVDPEERPGRAHLSGSDRASLSKPQW